MPPGDSLKSVVARRSLGSRNGLDERPGSPSRRRPLKSSPAERPADPAGLSGARSAVDEASFMTFDEARATLDVSSLTFKHLLGEGHIRICKLADGTRGVTR